MLVGSLYRNVWVLSPRTDCSHLRIFPPHYVKLALLRESKDGQAALSLLCDFLECFGLVATQSVLKQEANLDEKSVRHSSREIEGDLELSPSSRVDSTPMLVQLVRRARADVKTSGRSAGTSREGISPSSLPPANSASAMSPPRSSSISRDFASSKESVEAKVTLGRPVLKSLSPKSPSPIESGRSPTQQKLAPLSRSPKAASSASSSSFDAASSASRASPSSRTSPRVESKEGRSSSSQSSGKAQAEHNRNNDDIISMSKRDGSADDDYDDDFEDVISEDEFEVADAGLVLNSGESGEFFPPLNRSGNAGTGGLRSSAERSTDSLNMSTSILSMDVSVQGSLALESYDFVEVAQTPK